MTRQFVPPLVLSLSLSVAAPCPAVRAEEVAIQPERLLRDWLEQDCPEQAEECFRSHESAQLEIAVISRVLEECDRARALRWELEQLVGQELAGNDERWQTLYRRACWERRKQRLAPLVRQWPRIVFTKHFNLGGSHYAYTENLTDTQYIERERTNSDFRMGASLCLLTVPPDGRTTQEVLLAEPAGMIRDPAVAWDGERILFARRRSLDGDDYHLYEMEVATRGVRQLTFGDHVADYEGAYLPSGEIIFNSTRCIQTVDCWWTEVSNLYRCDEDGRFLRRLTFDQVHDNYPQVLDDGRVVYTRWEYSDRGQVYPQPLFQMNPDGTGQTEFYGNNSWFPTSILHARGIPGTQKLIAVLSGHHSHQRGKLAIIDPNRGRQEAEGVQLVAPVVETDAVRIDAYGQEGDQFQYPFPLSESEFLVAFDSSGAGGRRYDRPYGIYFMTADGRRELLACDPEISCNQPVPLAARQRPHQRPSTVDYSEKTGRYYVQDVYQGPGLTGIERGTIKRLRVVSIEFRVAGIGSNRLFGPAGGALASTPVSTGTGTWDVKRVLGSTEVHPDGSAFFEVPARTPVYFQLLDERNHVVQTMRSWSTLQPDETFSCVGCHESKSRSASVGRRTQASLARPQRLEPFHGPARGFSFAAEIQPVLDRNCVECHHREVPVPTQADQPRPPSKGETEGKPVAFSLLGKPFHDPASKRNWSDSYIALTHSYMTDRGLHGNSNDMVDWISAQSVPSLLPPYQGGAARSGLITLIEGGHYDVVLTREELDKIACWIDLLVPFCGDYTEAAAWSEAEWEKHTRFQTKREQWSARERASIEALAREATAEAGGH